MIKTLLFDFKNEAQEIILSPGVYKFEAWGASGAFTNCGQRVERRGRGAYVSGVIKLRFRKTFYVYVGQEGSYDEASFNGIPGKPTGYLGGGATDFRLKSGENWNDTESLKSRIMVAGAGGGNDCLPAGDGGTFEGLSPLNNGSVSINPTPGTQISGGTAGKFHNRPIACDGGFGFGGSGDYDEESETRYDAGGGGGGGYYGGGGVSGFGGGGGGSSFVSGHIGCNAIKGDIDDIQPSGQSIHFSQLYFESSHMISGNDTMPSPRSSNLQTGNIGNGFAKITILSLNLISCKRQTSFSYFLFVLISLSYS